ncbi:hypothetical protein QIH80_09540 [Bradyrhizobium elkanii]|nr:hypothetical protein QIH80_09540 [Bradyrhizobium elkanii]
MAFFDARIEAVARRKIVVRKENVMVAIAQGLGDAVSLRFQFGGK